MKIKNLTRESGVRLCDGFLKKMRAGEIDPEKVSDKLKAALIQFEYVIATVPGCELVFSTIKAALVMMGDRQSDIDLCVSNSLLLKEDDGFKIT